MRIRLLAVALCAAMLLPACASTNRNLQEVDDVYVTEADRASERAEALAQAEMENANRTEKSPPTEDEGITNAQPEEEYLSPSEQARRDRERARAERRANRSPASRTLLYVLESIVGIAFNVLLLLLLY